MAGLTAFVLAGTSLRDRFAPVPSDALDQRVAGPSDAATEIAAPPAIALPLAPARVRPVAPEVVAAPPVDFGALERVEARNPLSEIGAARSPSEGPPRETILFRPLATGGGVFLSLGYEVELAGIIPTDAREICVSDDVSWPCGIHARTAFRNWLRGRALNCAVPPAPTGETIVTDCRLGKQDPSAWLVAYGWARAAAGGAYAELEEKARAERRGLFGPAPATPAAVAGETNPSPEVDTSAPADSEATPSVSEPLSGLSGLSGG